MERSSDLAMFQFGTKGNIAVLFMQNQERIDYSMPIRVMVNESLEYGRQLREKKNQNTSAYKEDYSLLSDPGEYLCKVKKSDRFTPVISLVVYWGDKKWDGATNLYELLDFSDIDEELKKYVSNHSVHFIHVDEISRPDNFKTEIKHTFALYNFRNDKNKFLEYIEQNKQEISHLDDETCFTITKLINEKQLINYLNVNDEQEETDMCKALDDMRHEARQEGIEFGIEQGIEAFILDYIEENFSKEKITQKLQRRFGLNSEQAEEYFEKYAYTLN